jgi:hypothetical protein
MNNDEKKELILKFINGPLQEYLLGEISFGRFKELINETCGTDFSYDQLYPSYLFNLEVAQKTAVVDIKAIRQPKELSDFDQKMRICHQYGLCIQSDIELYMCGTCGVCPRTKEQSKAFKKGELK